MKLEKGYLMDTLTLGELADQKMKAECTEEETLKADRRYNAFKNREGK